MIKHRVYVFFVALVLLLFFTFQMLQLNLIWNDKWVSNEQMLEYQIAQKQKSSDVDGMEDLSKSFKSYFIVSSNHDANNFNNVKRALDLLKFSNRSFTTLDELPETIPDGLTGIIICDGNLDKIGNMEVLVKYLQAGVLSFFVNRLDRNAANYVEYEELFGIEKNGGAYFQEGVDFLEEVLVTGLYFNAEYRIMANKLELNGKCKVYAVGYDEEIEKYYDRNPMIWRTYYKDGGALLFFNANFMDDFKSVGIFSGMLSANEDVFVYPVVNASIILLDGIPYFSTENSEMIKKAYIRNIEQFQYDVVWNDLMSITKGIKMKYTFYPEVGPGQDKIEKYLLKYFGKEIFTNKFELGCYPSTNINKILPNYIPMTQMHYSDPRAKSQVVFDNHSFGFVEDNIVGLPIVNSGHITGGLEKFADFSVASALGYVSRYLDIKGDVFQNEEAVDVWTDYKLKFTQGVYSVLKLYEYIQPETASEAAVKMGRYLNCEPEIETNDDSIILKSSTEGTISYMLRTKREITSFENCTVEHIRKDFYFITVQDKDAVLKTEFKTAMD